MSTRRSATDVSAHTNRIAAVNARIDRLPAWGLPRATLMLLALSSLFSFYDITSMGVVIPAVAADFNLPATAFAAALSANLAGYMVGAVVLGTIGDRMGRKATFVAVVLVLAAGSLLTAFSWNLASLAVFRFITGAGTGSQIALITTIFAEFSSTHRRGYYLQLNQVAAGVGLIFAPWLAFALMDTVAYGWRIVLGAGVLVAFAALLGKMIPESPRWLAERGRIAEAESGVDDMEDTLRRRGFALPQPEMPSQTAPVESAPSWAIFRPPYLGRMVVVLLFWFLFYLTSYGFLGFHTTLLAKMGFDAQNILITAAGYVGFLVGPILAWLVTDRVQRKYLLAAVALMEAVGATLLATATAFGLTILGGFLIATGVMAGTVGYTYTAEIFPTRVRASAVAVAQSGGHFAGVVGPFVTAAVLGAFGPRATYVQFLLSILLAGVIILVAGRKTSGARLSEAAQ